MAQLSAKSLLAILGPLLLHVVSGLPAGCLNPMKSLNYRLGEGPAAHVKRLGRSRWQDYSSVDFLAAAGMPVYALVAGTVCDPAKDKQCVWGKTPQELKDRFSLNSFYLNGSDGKQYYYTHLQNIVARPGQAVAKGELVGYVGAYNGRNAHLHLAVRGGNPCDVLLKCVPADSRSCK
uniref:M23ase beta-sheet core domain-containing protein n=1 Tax=Tetradesmus obliquus TaxID=3088 RepID=A0A383VL12_TETOB|eukprot:jgi/Sobl393_1/5984/SZX65519.1